LLASSATSPPTPNNCEIGTVPAWHRGTCSDYLFYQRGCCHRPDRQHETCELLYSVNILCYAAESSAESSIISAGFLGDVVRGATVPLPKIQREQQEQQQEPKQQQQPPRLPQKQPQRQAQ